MWRIIESILFCSYTDNWRSSFDNNFENARGRTFVWLQKRIPDHFEYSQKSLEFDFTYSFLLLKFLKLQRFYKIRCCAID